MKFFASSNTEPMDSVLKGALLMEPNDRVTLPSVIERPSITRSPVVLTIPLTLAVAEDW